MKWLLVGILYQLLFCHVVVANPFSLQGRATRAGKLSFSFVREGRNINRWQCQLDFESDQGRRYGCGTQPFPLEFVYTPGEPDGAAIRYERDAQSELVKYFYQCEVHERLGKLRQVNCNEFVPQKVVDEGKLRSPIKSTFPLAAPISNLHVVGKTPVSSSKLLRSMRPTAEEDYSELLSAGVRSVLIFKNSVNGDVEEEHEKWRLKADSMDIGAENLDIKDIGFLWKDHKSFRHPCRQTISALRFIRDSLKVNKSTLFHCTVGEDRTGYLAAVYRLLAEKGKSHSELFQQEMCDRGFEKGNALKPYDNVTLKIRDSVTKLYLKMAYLIEENRFSMGRLSYNVCDSDPELEQIFRQRKSYDYNQYRCDVSTRFRVKSITE